MTAPGPASRPLEGERKFVTVLFADVVGSTQIGEELDPEQVAELMNGVFALMNTAVSRHGGTVARLMGDAVLAFFGAPATHEDDAERAVHAGLAIQAAAAEYARTVQATYGVDFAVRVGINSGLVVLAIVGDEIRSELTAMGDTTNVASRLQSAAPPGAVLISADTQHLVRNLFDFKVCTPIELRGRSVPVDTYEVVQARPVPGRMRGLEGIASPLVGRDSELQILGERLEALRGGTGSVVLITGEAGLGKSRLVAEARARHGGDLRWLEGRAISFGEPPSYYPWQQVVRQAVDATEDDAPESVLAAIADRAAPGLSPEQQELLGVLLGVGSTRGSAADLDLARFENVDFGERLAGALGALLAELATTRPAVIVLDDLHWADRASLQLLTRAFDVPGKVPVLIVGLLRLDRTAPSWQLLEDVEQTAASHRRLDLVPLSMEQSRQLLVGLVEAEPRLAPGCDLILAKSEGNPFFLEEVIRSLIDSGHIVEEAGVLRATAEITDVMIPETLLGVLTGRIDRLLEDPKRLLQTASVIGRMFARRVLGAVCDAAPERERIEDVDMHLRTLRDEELIRERVQAPDLEYMFKHALTQEAAYDSLLIRRRREFHRRVGEVIERLYSGRTQEFAKQMAHHFWLGGDWERAAGYAVLAGARADEMFAPEEAIEQYERAMEALEKTSPLDAVRLVDATLAWARPAMKLRRPAELLPRLARAVALAREAGDKRQLARALSWIGNVHTFGGTPAFGIEPLTESHRLADELGEEMLTMLPSFHITLAMVDQSPRLGLEALNDVIEMARKYRSPEIEAHALAARAIALARLGENAAALAAAQEARAVIARSTSLVKRADVNLYLAVAYAVMGDIEQALYLGELGTEESIEANAPQCTVFGHWATGSCRLAAGSPDDAARSLRQGLELFDANLGQVSAGHQFRNQLNTWLQVAELRQGKAEAVDGLEEARANAEVMGDEFTAAFAAEALASAHVDRGELERAAARIEAAVGFYRRNGMLPFLVQALPVAARVYRAQGLTREADLALEEVERLRAQIAAAA